MDLSPETRLDTLIERDLTLGDAPGILWTPALADSPTPLILLGHPGDIGRMRPRLEARARAAAAQGFASVTLELPGTGARARIVALDEARAELRAAVLAGERPTEDVVDRLILPLVDQAAAEWRALVDALLELPGIGGPVAVSGGIVSLGVRLAATDPRIVAASLFAGSWVPAAILEEARTVTVPAHVLLQWDDEGNDRQQALDLFDALGSTEKTLQANLGGHTGVPSFAGDDAARFLARHLT
ncbi:hypothetical protein [Demequina soli]|uniref:hypothetical protein n=1 Tax=Demequina soli TaxID=1638987 RepID=UPI0007830395|nr:hypothetical protein [Demequina soli]